MSIELWYWRIPSDRKPGKTVVSTWRMTEAEALQRYPTAVKVEGSLEERTPPGYTGDFLHRPRAES